MKVTVNWKEYKAKSTVHAFLVVCLHKVNLTGISLKKQTELINKKFNSSITEEDLQEFYSLNYEEDFEREHNRMESLVFNGNIEI